MNVLVSELQTDAAPAPIGDAGPFTLSCVGETVTQTSDLGSYPVAASIQVGRFRGYNETVACTERRGRQCNLCVDAFQSFTPNLLIISDRHQRLCLGGQITASGLIWCEPVTSDVEVRRVVLDASSVRSRAMAAFECNEALEARALRFRAAALEARLIDPVWRFASLARVRRAA